MTKIKLMKALLWKPVLKQEVLFCKQLLFSIQSVFFRMAKNFGIHYLSKQISLTIHIEMIAVFYYMYNFEFATVNIQWLAKCVKRSQLGCKKSKATPLWWISFYQLSLSHPLFYLRNNLALPLSQPPTKV